MHPRSRRPRLEGRETEDLRRRTSRAYASFKCAIDMTMETTLMTYLEKQDRERDTRRGKIHYGCRYVDASRTLEREEELPTELMNLINKLMDAKDSEDIILLAVQPKQVSVNTYEPGVSIE